MNRAKKYIVLISHCQDVFDMLFVLSRLSAVLFWRENRMADN